PPGSRLRACARRLPGRCRGWRRLSVRLRRSSGNDAPLPDRAAPCARACAGHGQQVDAWRCRCLGHRFFIQYLNTYFGHITTTMSASTIPAPAHGFAARLAGLARRSPDAVALYDRDRPLRFAALSAAVDGMAAGLAQAGVRPGSRVALWLPNCAQWVVAFLACARLGALVLAVNTRFRSTEVADILGRGRAEWLVYWPGFKGIDFASILDDVPDDALQTLRGVIALDGAPDDAPDDAPGGAPAQVRGRPVLPWRQLLAGAPPAASAASAVPAAPADAAALCFTTSGTTSLPKFVLHDQGTLLRHGDAIAQAYGYGNDACVLAAAPFCGAFGFAMLAGALAAGVPLVCEPVYDTGRTAQAIRRHRITHAFANNESLAQLFQAGQPGDFASLRLCGFARFAP